MSASVKIMFYLVWLIISVKGNEPKLTETTVNYFALRQHRLIEECRRETRIAYASLISSRLSQLFMILATLATEIRNSFNMFFALQKFALKEDNC